jgi:dipeptidyl aminopeptidase/acylaminoacyl peptidase
VETEYALFLKSVDLLLCIRLQPRWCAPSGDTNLSYLDRLGTFESQLTISSPAPQDYSDDEPPEGVQVVHYLSGDMSLKAWLALPEDVSDKKRPGVVYIHGGFAFGTGDFIDAQPFRDAGFVVMTPMLRGENGNPGNFELFLGEVDDAASAVKWLASQPFIDPKRLYVFGHSTGGGISALLTLRTNVPVVHTGSAGGLYPSNVFSDGEILYLSIWTVTTSEIFAYC